MGQILAICGMEIRRVFKQPRSWVLMFLMPIFFTFVFGSMTGGGEGVYKTKLAVADEDRTAVSQALVEKLAVDELLSVERVDSAAEAEQMVKDKKVAGSVVVPNGYQKSFVEGNKAEVVFQHGPELAIATGIKQLLDDAMAQTAVRMQAAKTWSAKTGQGWQGAYEKLTSSAAVAGGGSGSVGVESQVVVKGKESSQMNNSAGRAVGFSIMFVMMSLLSVTGTILEARKNGVWYRMMAAPATRLQILGGYMLAFFVTGWLQFGILMGLSSVLFDVEWGNWIGEVVLVSAFLLCVVGLGMFIAGWVKTTEQQSALGSMVIVATCMLGGVYWPLDIVGDTMRKMAEFVPQKWAMDGFTELIARGGAVGDVVGEVVVLMGFAVVFMVVRGLMRVRYE